jgi:hypothetical protein
MKIGIVPFYKALYNNKLFDISDNVMNTDNALTPYFEIKKLFEKENIEVNTIDYYNYENVDAVLFFSLDYDILHKCLNKNIDKLIYFAWEPEVVDKRHSKKWLKQIAPFFDAIMTWNDDLIDNVKYYKINYPYYFKTIQINCSEKDFYNKKLLVNISGNKKSCHPNELYSERLKVINYYNNNKQSENFELYGKIWNEKFICSKGICLNKSNVYQNFKFALCLENMCNINGYITEKIFDCFTSGVVPIYWGAVNITSYIPQECFINYQKFNSIEDLDKYLTTMKYNDYMKYIEAINDYLSSEKIDFFTSFYFVRNVKVVLNEHIKRKSHRTCLLNLYKIIDFYYKIIHYSINIHTFKLK